jgi:hypothetical protein
LEKGNEEMLKAADPLFLFGIEITTMQGNYARVGETTTYAPPSLDAE